MARATRVNSVPKKVREPGSGALARVRKYFANVNEVADAKGHLDIEVTPRDVSASKRKAHSECAMAVACKRAKALDGVIISRSVAYLIKGNKATRYEVPNSVAREVVSFDRGAGFEPGTYHLDKPQHELSRPKPRGAHTGTGKGMPHHVTTNVRAILGSDKVA